MKIAAKTTLFIFLASIVSLSYQFEDFGLFNALSHAKHNRTDSNRTLTKLNNDTNVTNPQNLSSNAGNEEKDDGNKTDTEDSNKKQKHFLKKNQNSNRTLAKKNTKKVNKNESSENKKSNNETNNNVEPTKFLRSQPSENLENEVESEDDSQSSNQTSPLSEEDRKLLCEKLDSVLSNLTDFDIKVSQLRADFMNYTKSFLNHHYTMETPEKKEEFAKNKDAYLVSYSEKMNDLNQLLQKYKLKLYVIKNREQCPNKVLNILNEVQTNFINLVTLLKDEIAESKIPLSFIMINIGEKEQSGSKLAKADDKNGKFLSQVELKKTENVLL